MSIAEFKAALQDQAYKKWFKASSKSILNQTTSELRDTEQKASKTSFTITEDTIKQIAEYLSGSSINEQEVSTIKNKMVEFMGKKRSFDIAPNGDLYFPRVSFDTISTILDKGFGDLLKSSGGKRISDIMQKGHVYGIATNLLRQTTVNLERSQAPEQVKRTLISVLDQFEKELIRQDQETANIKDPEYYLYAKYKKNPKRHLVELQVKSKNQQAGLDAKLITNQLRRYFAPENFVALEKNLKKEPDTAFIKKLLNTPGSPSFIDLVRMELVETLAGKNNTAKEFISPSVEIAKQTAKINKSKVQKKIKDDLAKVRKLKQQIKNIQIMEQQASLTSLQTLLNQTLAERIKQNMGTPRLNNRTGRFAGSAKVERMSQSREGMITAFYSYMKYPYQTFEPGFKQGSEQRNPKTLISKSIRELAATVVGNRMRAVLI